MGTSEWNHLKIILYTKHFRPSSGTQDLLRKKFGRLSRFHDGIHHMGVSIGKELSGGYEMTLRIKVPEKPELVFKEFGPSLYALMDVIYDKAETRLTRLNQRKTNAYRETLTAHAL